jgi:hypothetical protein
LKPARARRAGRFINPRQAIPQNRIMVNRRYIPICFMPQEVIGSNLVLFVPYATKFHFGILTSAK